MGGYKVVVGGGRGVCLANEFLSTRWISQKAFRLSTTSGSSEPLHALIVQTVHTVHTVAYISHAQNLRLSDLVALRQS
jgi:hypothetical protein